jgi:hypothetical protein
MLDAGGAHDPFPLSADESSGHVEPLVAVEPPAGGRDEHADGHGVRDAAGYVEAAELEPRPRGGRAGWRRSPRGAPACPRGCRARSRARRRVPPHRAGESRSRGRRGWQGGRARSGRLRGRSACSRRRAIQAARPRGWRPRRPAGAVPRCPATPAPTISKSCRRGWRGGSRSRRARGRSPPPGSPTGFVGRGSGRTRR